MHVKFRSQPVAFPAKNTLALWLLAHSSRNAPQASSSGRLFKESALQKRFHAQMLARTHRAIYGDGVQQVHVRARRVPDDGARPAPSTHQRP